MAVLVSLQEFLAQRDAQALGQLRRLSLCDCRLSPRRQSPRKHRQNRQSPQQRGGGHGAKVRRSRKLDELIRDDERAKSNDMFSRLRGGEKLPRGAAAVASGEAKAGRLAPFESLAEAEELLRQFEPTESSSTRDPVYQATVKHSKEEWHAKLEKKANLLRMQAVVQEKWQEAHDRKATNTRMRDRLMLLALDLSRLQSENVARRKGIDAENKRRREELARIQRDHSTVTLPVTCPDNAMGGHTLRVKSKGNSASMQDKQFDVVVPEGVMPGQRFNVQFHVPPD